MQKSVPWTLVFLRGSEEDPESRGAPGPPTSFGTCFDQNSPACIVLHAAVLCAFVLEVKESTINAIGSLKSIALYVNHVMA